MPGSSRNHPRSWGKGWGSSHRIGGEDWDHAFTREGDAGVHRHFQRRGSGADVQPDERVCIPRGERQAQCRPVHRGRPAHTQRMVQLLEVHPRTVRPTDRSLRGQNPDAKSRGTRDNDARLRHLEPARVPLRHAAPSPPQVLDLLHRLGKAQSRRPLDFLSGHAYQDGKWEHRGDFTQEADLVCGICGAHGGYETAEVRDVRRIGKGHELCGGPGKGVDEVFPGRPQSFRHERRSGNDCSPGRGGMAKNGGTRGGTFHGEMGRCRESQGWTTRHAVVCPNATGRTKQRIAQSKRARAGSLALVD